VRRVWVSSPKFLAVGREATASSYEPRHGIPGLGVRVTAQLQCIYSNAHSMGNEQEELEATVWQDSYDLVAITETWRDDSHDWSAAMDGYKLFRREKRGKRCGGVALYVRDCFDCTELDNCDYP